MKVQPFYIAVCDDDEKDRKEIAEMAEQICEMEKIDAEIICFADGNPFLQELKNGMSFDMLFLDVMMPEMDGMKLSRYLRSEKQDLPIVFISSNRDMALRGYEVSAVRYLAKPLEKEYLREAIVFCYGDKNKKKELLFPITGGIRKVSPEEIIYVEIRGRKSHITQEQEEWDTALSIDRLGEMLSGSGFVRCHQSFLVNCRFIRTLRTAQIELVNGVYIPVSKYRIKEVRRYFFEYMEG